MENNLDIWILIVEALVYLLSCLFFKYFYLSFYLWHKLLLLSLFLPLLLLLFRFVFITVCMRMIRVNIRRKCMFTAFCSVLFCLLNFHSAGARISLCVLFIS